MNCRNFEPKAVITGGLRYSFNNIGQQNLFMNCQSTEGRHDYVTGSQVCGPNVFYNCTASQTYSDIGPHHRWASGTLYDNIITDGSINVQDRGQMGSGHGWAGVTQVLWNCRVGKAQYKTVDIGKIIVSEQKANMLPDISPTVLTVNGKVKMKQTYSHVHYISHS